MRRDQSFKSNALSLYAIQGLQYLVPIFTLPVLTARLGVPVFGQLAYWQALVGTLGLLVDYGFNYSAVRSLAQANGDSEQVGHIFVSTMVARFVMALPAILLLMLIPHWLATASTPMQLLGSVMLLGIAASPAWYLIGVKRNASLAYASAATALATVVSTVLLVHGDHALYIAAAIQFGAPLVNALIANFLVLRLAPPARSPLSARRVFGVIRESFPLFLTNLSAGLYTTLNPFILGIVASPGQVAYFSFGERIARSARAALNPLMGAIYPYSVSAATEPRQQHLVRRASIFLTVAAALLTLLVIVTAPLIVSWLAPADFAPSVLVTRILAINIFAVTLSNLIGIQGLVAKGKDKIVTWTVTLAAPLHLVTFLLAGYYYGAIGGSVAFVVTEVAVTSMLAVYALSQRDDPSRA